MIISGVVFIAIALMNSITRACFIPKTRENHYFLARGRASFEAFPRQRNHLAGALYPLFVPDAGEEPEHYVPRKAITELRRKSEQKSVYPRRDV
jgi:hypothetical protein